MNAGNQTEGKESDNLIDFFSPILLPPFLFVLILWLVAYAEWKFNLNWNIYALFPHTLKGARGILFAPLLHDGFYHLISNTVPLFILGVFLLHPH